MRRARTCYYCYYYYILYRRTRINPLALMTGSRCFFHIFFFINIIIYTSITRVTFFYFFLTLLLTRPFLYNILYIIFISTRTLPPANSRIYTAPRHGTPHLRAGGLRVTGPQP